MGPLPDGEGGFGGDEQAIAFAGDGFAEDFFGDAVGINVGGVEEIDAGVEADVDEAGGFGDVAAAPGFEEFVGAAEGAGAEGENGDLKSGVAELSEFHGGKDARDSWRGYRGRVKSSPQRTRRTRRGAGTAGN